MSTSCLALRGCSHKQPDCSSRSVLGCLQKHLRLQDIAQRCRLPCCYIVDSGGANLPHQAGLRATSRTTLSVHRHAARGNQRSPVVPCRCVSRQGPLWSHFLQSGAVGCEVLSESLLQVACTHDESLDLAAACSLHCRRGCQPWAYLRWHSFAAAQQPAAHTFRRWWDASRYRQSHVICIPAACN